MTKKKKKKKKSHNASLSGLYKPKMGTFEKSEAF
jgi:hypothetical protein